MKQEVADLWVEALRSGDYEQATGTLAKVDSRTGEVVGHCCLGVLCEVAIKNGVSLDRASHEHTEYVDEDTDETEVWYDNITFDDRDDLLPQAVKDWAGIRTNDGSVENNYPDGSAEEEEMDNEFSDSLAGLNDSGKKFRDIANLIEKYTKEL
jgi:hypothetical protein